MAAIEEPTEQGLAEWRAFVAGLPEDMRASVAEKPPWLLYRHAGTGDRVLIAAYCEDGTCRMVVSEEFNLVTFSREVFGVPLFELTECDLPGPDERVGALLKTREEIEAWIEENRAAILAHRAPPN